jgi:hypothetical protein
MSDQADHRATTIQHMREAIAERVRKTSLRRVAREVGLSPTGLKKFINGSDPYSPTVRRLNAWYLRYAALPMGHVETEDAGAALAILVADLVSGPRLQAVGDVLACVGTGYEQSGRTPPAWLSELGARYQSAA